MNSTASGRRLERAIFNLLKAEVDADRFFLKKEYCKLFLNKGYYSPDRKAEIVFDVSIEAFLPAADKPSVLVLIECKNYATDPVPVDDVEEFFAKCQQVAPGNAKAIIASNTAFQSGAREYARSKKMGLLRYFGPSHFRWELYRSPSASLRGSIADARPAITAGLTRPEFQSDTFDLFLQGPMHVTNSLWDFIEELLLGPGMSSSDVHRLSNPGSRRRNVVPYRSKLELEAVAVEVLDAIGYRSGPVPLDEICHREHERSGLTVDLEAPPTGWKRKTLGRIQFAPLHIDIFRQSEPHPGRDRFTLAHELAHHLLGHGEFMQGEFCEEDDFVLHRRAFDSGSDIARLEHQANYLASCLLLPKANFQAEFWRQIAHLGIRDRGMGPLYVDYQRCNLNNYYAVTASLINRYRVSRTATHIRLQSLGLLRDGRADSMIRVG